MKTRATILAAMLLTLFFFNACEKELTELPPETQSGKHTFGCYVNGELFVHETNNPFRPSPTRYASYYPENNTLFIFCIGSNDMGTITLQVLNPEENIKKTLQSAEYRNLIVLNEETGGNITIQELEFITYKGENVGKILLTRFDIANGIVSGTFECEIPWCESYPSQPLVGNSIVKITQGRFDFRDLQIKH